MAVCSTLITFYRWSSQAACSGQSTKSQIYVTLRDPQSSVNTGSTATLRQLYGTVKLLLRAVGSNINRQISRSFIDCFHDPIMQHVLGGSLHKNNSSYLLLRLYHASVNRLSIVLMQIPPPLQNELCYGIGEKSELAFHWHWRWHFIGTLFTFYSKNIHKNIFSLKSAEKL